MVGPVRTEIRATFLCPSLLEIPVPTQRSKFLAINARLQIPLSELTFSFSRSSGPGGQNVNKVNTQVMLRFDVRASPSLTNTQKSLLLSKLRTRIDSLGRLRVISSRHRTQAANRNAATERFCELLAAALVRKKHRIKTKTSKAAKARRLRDKSRRADLKRDRGRPSMDD